MSLELRLQIDKQETYASGALAIVCSSPLTLAGIGRVLKGKEALQFLYQQENNFRKKAGLNPISPETTVSTFHVAYPQSLAALKLLAASGLLQYNGKGLACDFFGKSEFYYLIENQTAISGRIKQGGQDFALTDCDFLCAGPPHWYIKGIALKFIGTDIPWKELHQVFSSPASIKLQKLRENYGIGSDTDDSAPKLVYKGEAVEIIDKPPSIFPLLVLHDRMGAFADLWMAYSEASSEERHRVLFNDTAGWIKDAKGKPQFKRDAAAEKQWEQDLLETDFIRKNVGSTHYYCPIDRVAKSLTFLLEVGWKIEDSQSRSVCRQTESSMAIETHADAFLVKGKIRYGDHETDIQNIVGAFNRRERFVQLGIGAVGLLPAQAIGESLSMAIEDGEIVHEGIKVNRNRFGTLAAAFETDHQMHCDSAFTDLKEKLLNFQGFSERLPATSFSGILRPYQQAGVNWLAFLYEHHFHGLLADDMGLGKTVQVLAFLSQINASAPILLVLPTSLIFNWKREIEKFIPGMNFLIQHGPERTRDPAKLKGSKIILTSYTTLRLDLYLFEQLYYECIILDEAQVIKNSSTQTAQTIYKLNGRFRLSLSGTPMENHLGEMWSHFRFLIPGLFDTEEQFTADAAAGSLDPRHLQKIRRKIMPFFLRRKKEEVAKDLPEKIEQVVWVEMSAEQRQVYEDFLAGFKGNLFKKVEVDGMSKHRMEVLEAILRLRQICCHPLLALPQSDAPMPSAKLDLLLEDLETAISEGAKVLVYSQFTSMLALISKEIKARGWQYAYLDGSTQNREKIVSQFQEDPNIPLFLISLKAGGIGLNLTAADYVFLYDPWWNVAAEDQAINRAHRIGRKSTVIAKRYVMLESVEEKIMRLKDSKKSVIDSIIDDDLGKLQLTIDDLRFLIE